MASVADQGSGSGVGPGLGFLVSNPAPVLQTHDSGAKALSPLRIKNLTQCFVSLTAGSREGQWVREDGEGLKDCVLEGAFPF